MGTVILAGSVIIWFLSNFPQNNQYNSEYRKEIDQINKTYMDKIGLLNKNSTTYKEERDRIEIEKQFRIKNIESKENRVNIENSFIGIIGKTIEPFFRPLKFSWREGVALITGFVAKEIVVSTLGVLYNPEGGEKPQSLGNALKEKSSMTPLTAYAFLVFVLIYTPCLATVATIRRETGSTKWTLFSVGYQITLAWILAFLIVNIGKLFVGS